MEKYFGLILILGVFLIIVFSNRFLFSWVKFTISAYYSVVSYVFIAIKEKMDRQYANILPVPTEYWDKNSGWVDTMVGYFFLPMIVILLFIYYKWFTGVKSKNAKLWVVASIIPSVGVFIFAAFMFVFAYGYRP